MTDLLTRSPPSGSGLERSRSHRPLQVNAMIAALAAVATGVGTCMAAAVVGWFLADAGSHGSTTDALRVGADAWLLGHGSRTVAGGTVLGILPLGLTAMLALVAFRCGRWASKDAGTESVDNRAVSVAIGLATACYTMATIVVLVLNTHDNSDPSLPRALLGAVLMGALGLGAGLASGTGRLRAWIALVPEFARTTIEGAITAAVLVVAAGAALVAVSLVVSFNDVSMLMSSMRLGIGDALMVTVLTALVAPNAALFGASWLVGPGFVVGAGSTVSPGEVSLGALPNFPLLGALPVDGPVPAVFAGLMAVPVLIAAVAAGRAQHQYGVRAWDSAALRGFAVGLGGAVLLSVMMLFAGGPMGTGRMAQFGPQVAQVLVVSLGGMSIGGLAGGLLVTAVQRRRDRRGATPEVR